MKISIILFISILLVSCSKESSEVIEVIGSNQFISGYLDSSNTNLEIDTIVSSGQFVNGGSSFATITTQQSDSVQINIGVKNYKGYYKIIGKPDISGKIPVIIDFKANAPDSLTLIFNIENESGQSRIQEYDFSKIESETNGIQINLSWDINNDLDLHLLTPSGKEISYKNPGFKYKPNSKDTLRKLYKKYNAKIPIREKIPFIIADSIGIILDVDSNPGCNIDGINSENIIIDDTQLAEKGIYTIIANLYKQCNRREKTTNFVVIAKYKDKFLETLEGKNPFIGYKDGRKNDFQKVIEFEIK